MAQITLGAVIRNIGLSLAGLGFSTLPLYLSACQVGRDRSRRIHLILCLLTTLSYVLVAYATANPLDQVTSLVRLGAGSGILKAWDLYSRHGTPISIVRKKRAQDDLAFLLVSELRFESLNISTCQKTLTNNEEYREYVKNLVFIAVLQFLPQSNLLKTVQILLAVDIIWTTMHFVLRYDGQSPPLFGKLWSTDSISAFWTYEWHNAFASPCIELGYRPVRRRAGRAAGVIAAFCVTGMYHVWSFAPILPAEGQFRVGVFFVMMGIGCCIDSFVFGNLRSPIRRIAGWSWALGWGCWACEKCQVPNGIQNIDFNRIIAVASE